MKHFGVKFFKEKKIVKKKSEIIKKIYMLTLFLTQQVGSGSGNV